MYATIAVKAPDRDVSAARARTVLDEWVPRAVAGDRAARQRVVAVVYPLVRRYCFARIGQGALQSLAEDVAHETCVGLMTALPRFDDRGSAFLTYVYAIAAHKVADAHRATGRSCVPLDEAGEPVCPDAGPEECVLNGESGDRARQLVDSLPPRDREIVVMRLVWGMSAAETAAALGTTAGAVRVAQHRALNRLRDRLGDRTRIEAAA
ncbi:RNA polymerase sigma factor ShbA [Prescottella sp. R16]|uniref:RNA polymerase sigma factor ShbA n=1 Tax=Prescottella sp. R16 TaxID=3064529 RepID=UPI00272E8E76|nr:RNA polymerase sigma factor ShbA [Prescottella sp. R16]